MSQQHAKCASSAILSDTPWMESLFHRTFSAKLEMRQECAKWDIVLK